MAEIFWEAELVSKLNQFSLCPLPLARFIVPSPPHSSNIGVATPPTSPTTSGTV